MPFNGRKNEKIKDFIKDTAIDVYNDGRLPGDLPLETLDTSEFESGRYVEETSQNFYDTMFDMNSGKETDKEYCMITDADGKILCVNKGDEHSCGFTQQQISQYADGGTIIHSHPFPSNKGDAGTFSGTDIAGMGVGERSQVIAAPEGQYIIEFPPGADIQGFKQEIADDRGIIAQKLVGIRIASAKEWFNANPTDAERERTRAEAMRTCLNKQKQAWSEHIGKVAEKHGIEYHLYVDTDAYNGKRPGYIPNKTRSRTQLFATSQLKNQEMRYGYSAHSIIVGDDDKEYGYFRSARGTSMCISLDDGDIIRTGDSANDFYKKSKKKTWLSILRKTD